MEFMSRGTKRARLRLRFSFMPLYQSGLVHFPTSSFKLLLQTNNSFVFNTAVSSRPILTVNMNSLVRPLSILKYPPSLRPVLAARLYATETGLGTSNASSRPRRKAVTPFNDDGRVPWGELSGKEKAARATQQTFNFSFIIIGAILTVSSGGTYGLAKADTSCRQVWHM
jgi:hypothetical protein